MGVSVRAEPCAWLEWCCSWRFSGGLVGCGSAEPYSTEVRVVLQQMLLADLEANPETEAILEDRGISRHDLIRCMIEEMEEQVSEEDLFLLSPAETQTLGFDAGVACGEKYRD
tara:strand:+ start:90 stop:428 length:339 start_codon:yes stop_codon:yes gene_type:complete